MEESYAAFRLDQPRRPTSCLPQGISARSFEGGCGSWMWDRPMDAKKNFPSEQFRRNYFSVDFAVTSGYRPPPLQLLHRHVPLPDPKNCSAVSPTLSRRRWEELEFAAAAMNSGLTVGFDAFDSLMDPDSPLRAPTITRPVATARNGQQVIGLNADLLQA